MSFKLWCILFVSFFLAMSSYGVEEGRPYEMSSALTGNGDMELESKSTSKELGSLLIQAARDGNKDAVAALLDRGADIDHADNDDNTAFTVASAWGHLGVMRLLLDRGADIEQADNNGNTALIWASYYGQLEVVRLLLEKRASINHINNAKYTALMEASARGHQAIVNLLEAELRERRQAVMHENLCAIPGLKRISAEVLKLVSQFEE